MTLRVLSVHFIASTTAAAAILPAGRNNAIQSGCVNWPPSQCGDIIGILSAAATGRGGWQTFEFVVAWKTVSSVVLLLRLCSIEVSIYVLINCNGLYGVSSESIDVCHRMGKSHEEKLTLSIESWHASHYRRIPIARSF